MIADETVQKCREGDRDAQRELYARTSDQVYRLLLRMTGSSEDAFDLSQETYLKVFARIDAFEGTSSVSTWIYRIAVNEALQHLRWRQRHARKMQAMASTIEADERPKNAGIAAIDVHQALAAIPDQERALIVLRHFDGLSYEEIGKVLDKPSGTIASALNRARHMLRDRLADNSARPVKTRPVAGI